MKVTRFIRCAVALLTLAAVVPLAAASPVGAAAHDSTTQAEARRVDRVWVRQIEWYQCFDYAECATVRLPLDYDNPRGPRTDVALLRIKARRPGQRIGSLFVNPGGPGGSGTEMAYFAPYFLDPDLLDRFDIVGMDPRGTNFSSNVRCFAHSGQQANVLRGLLAVPFPFTESEENAAINSARRFGKKCSSSSDPLVSSMSTAEVARDMDVIRRKLGDDELSYLGFSYGTQLGQVYANMFPDRVRAMVLDGVLDPVQWTGTPQTAGRPMTDRLRSADGATRALVELLHRCDAVGGRRCRFAAGDPVANYDLVAERLKKQPIEYYDPFTGEVFRFGYPELVSNTLGALYGAFGPEIITDNLAELLLLTEPPSNNGNERAAAERSFATRQHNRRATQQAERERSAAWAFPYDNFLEAFSAVVCSDSLNPPWATRWRALAPSADQRAKYFGRAWLWSNPQCASKTWTAVDEDAYRGPFNRRTAAPLLFVGNYWDPATNYDGAVSASNRAPNSRLLTSDSWGHTAYGTSYCVNQAVAAYLLRGALPSRATTCVGDYQPFQGGAAFSGGSSGGQARAASDSSGTRTSYPAENGRPPVRALLRTSTG